MADIDTSSVPVIAVTAAISAVVLLFVLLCNVSSKGKNQDNESEEKVQQNGSSSEKKTGSKPSQNSSKKSKSLPAKSRNQKPSFTHPWSCGSLKGHGSQVLDFDFSPNGKYLLSCGDDRSVFLWNTKDFSQREHKNQRGNVELDHATKIRFSPDSKAFIVSLGNAQTVRVFKIGKKPDGTFGAISSVMDFEPGHTKADILNIGIASTGKFIMTAYTDTTIIVWDLKGEVLATIDTHQMNNTCCQVSPCGRFIASSGFTSDVIAWEVVFDKSGGFKEVTSAFCLKGHKAGVHSFSFSNDSSRMATVSKDGTWKLWDTSVQYKQGQDPRLLYTGQFPYASLASLIALSPDSRTVAIAHGSSLSMYDTVSGEHCEDLQDVHQNSIRTLSFDNEGRYLLSAGDKHLHILHNVPGHRATIRELEEKKKASNSHAARERCQTQIDEAKACLTAILGGTGDE